MPSLAQIERIAQKAKAQIAESKKGGAGGSDRVRKAESPELWKPRTENKPQREAFTSPADRLFFGGAAGGG